MATLSLSFNIYVIHLHMSLRIRKLNRSFLVILECDRLSLCKARCQVIPKPKVAIFHNIDYVVAVICKTTTISSSISNSVCIFMVVQRVTNFMESTI